MLHYVEICIVGHIITSILNKHGIFKKNVDLKQSTRTVGVVPSKKSHIKSRWRSHVGM